MRAIRNKGCNCPTHRSYSLLSESLLHIFIEFLFPWFVFSNNLKFHIQKGVRIYLSTVSVPYRTVSVPYRTVPYRTVPYRTVPYRFPRETVLVDREAYRTFVTVFRDFCLKARTLPRFKFYHSAV
jgi:hypothetical protein